MKLLQAPLKGSFIRHVDPGGLPHVYEIGYENDPTGSRSYLFQLPGKDKPLTIMVNAVPYQAGLADDVEKVVGVGGIDMLFFTNAWRVVDGEKWCLRFPTAVSAIHSLEAQDGIKTKFIPLKLKGKGPWTNFPGVDIIFTPGLTPGHLSLLIRHPR